MLQVHAVLMQQIEGEKHQRRFVWPVQAHGAHEVVDARQTFGAHEAQLAVERRRACG